MARSNLMHILCEKYPMKIIEITGYVLLTTGLILVFYALASVLLVFMRISYPPYLISLNDIKADLGGSLTIIEGDTLTLLTNTFLWYILMFFMLIAGEKIAGIGIKILKELAVKAEK